MPILESLPMTSGELPQRRPQIAALYDQSKARLAKQIVDFSPALDLRPLHGAGVLVTGGSSGFGAHISETFARAGAYVTFLDINTEQGQAFEKKWRGEGLNVQFVHCDVTSWSGQLEAFKAAIAFHPKKTLSHVFANAGVVGHIDIIPSDDKFDATQDPVRPNLRQIQISLIGAYYTVTLGLHYVRVNRGRDSNRSIVMTGSLASFTGLPRLGDYTGAKFGMRGVLKALEKDAKAVGVRINMITPGFMNTGILRNADPGLAFAGHDFGRIEDVVKVCARFACDESIHARVATMNESGIFDVRDDAEGLNGGIEFDRLLSTGSLPIFVP